MLERIWLPVYLVRIALAQKGGGQSVTCSVEGLRGSFALFDMHETIADGVADGETFPPVIGPDRAERIARESLVTAILRRRSRHGKPVPGETQSVELVQWPFWVYYHARLFGSLDIKLLDACTGQPVGQKIKLGVLEAFRERARGTASHGSS